MVPTPKLGSGCGAIEKGRIYCPSPSTNRRIAVRRTLSTADLSATLRRHHQMRKRDMASSKKELKFKGGGLRGRVKYESFQRVLAVALGIVLHQRLAGCVNR